MPASDGRRAGPRRPRPRAALGRGARLRPAWLGFRKGLWREDGIQHASSVFRLAASFQRQSKRVGDSRTFVVIFGNPFRMIRPVSDLLFVTIEFGTLFLVRSSHESIQARQVQEGHPRALLSQQVASREGNPTGTRPGPRRPLRTPPVY
jgi:hypothetical protein